MVIPKKLTVGLTSTSDWPCSRILWPSWESVQDNFATGSTNVNVGLQVTLILVFLPWTLFQGWKLLNLADTEVDVDPTKIILNLQFWWVGHERTGRCRILIQTKFVYGMGISNVHSNFLKFSWSCTFKRYQNWDTLGIATHPSGDWMHLPKRVRYKTKN